ncbi:M23 family metallopeptidase [Kiloniella antarctica]|uniref:M23 family metallopeptidase n=1 Tax=Kiloniella antarctica TaxID=1550907 RepID=A0ABW5BPI2_9PROT
MYGIFHALCFVGALILSIAFAQADELDIPEFSIPLRCDFPNDCVVQNYMDVRPGPGVRDFRCGTLSYERHKGTDFRVLNYPLFSQGVKVLAAADGTVLRVKEGQEDGAYIREEGKLTPRTEEGNSVVVQHKGGWQTLYEHLRKRSITVKVGDAVQVGDALGVVGLSGKSEFTHLHFEIMHGYNSYDPFMGALAEGCLYRTSNSFWNALAQDKLKYIETGIVESGFSSEIPHQKQLPFSDERKRIALRQDAKLLIYWVEVFGVKIADRITLIYVDPAGKISKSQKVVKNNQASYFKYYGINRPEEGWLSGKYKGAVLLERIVEGKWQIVFSDNTDVTYP